MRTLLLPSVAMLVLVSACDCSGARVASDGGLTTCSLEVCDGVDNNCDGQIDEGMGTLKCGQGACAREVTACVNGQPQACTPGTSTAEVCDGLDNDCNGKIDDGLGTLSCGQGACVRTMDACVGGKAQTCTPIEPSPEICDGLDNDCNGTVDDGLPALTCGVGACANTTAACIAGVTQVCVPGTAAQEACDGLDNDCNGVADDGLVPLTCGAGACLRTVVACVSGIPQTCTPGLPATETCNGVDDDCDGTIDNHVSALTCGQGVCLRTIEACVSGGVQVCTPGAPSAEVCDTLDNDCNGLVDDGIAPTSCGVGACLRTIATCANGIVQTCVEGTPGTEVCNGLDDDCDGKVDNGVCNPPVVQCPSSLTALAGTALPLTATATPGDVGGTISSTTWSVSAKPAGSTAVPSPANAKATTYTPDVGGAFTLQFCATDATSRSACCTTSIATTACASPPSPPVSTACTTSWDGRPIVQFTPVPSGLVYELKAAGSSPVLASAAAGENWMRPGTRIAAGGPPPGTNVDLQVRACRTTDRTCCSAETPLQVSVVEVCATPVAPTTTNVVFSEYLTDGEGSCGAPVDCNLCQAGEAVEITNLSNCPVSLDTFHFAYRNAGGASGSYRWMNFGSADVIPPRGVYVAIRNRLLAPVSSASLGAESTGLYGLKISSLAMQGQNLCSGWFNNTGGASSMFDVSPGAVTTSPIFTNTNFVARIAPYNSLPTGAAVGASIGFDAVDSCGTVISSNAPTATLAPNQLGRLWHPCDAVVGAVPTCVRN